VLLVCFAIFSLTSCSDKSEALNKAPNYFSITLGRADGGNMGLLGQKLLTLMGI